jgi:hypothetical protein
MLSPSVKRVTENPASRAAFRRNSASLRNSGSVPVTNSFRAPSDAICSSTRTQSRVSRVPSLRRPNRAAAVSYRSDSGVHSNPAAYGIEARRYPLIIRSSMRDLPDAALSPDVRWIGDSLLVVRT